MIGRIRITRARLAVAAGTVLVVGASLATALVLAQAPTRQPARPASASSAAPALLSPFTGEPVKALGSVLAVKIDNIVYARPQTGLNSADIVYVLPVEGGLTRFLAVFSSHIPPVIGPVRSAREDDMELLRQFSRPAFAYSGAQPQLLPVVERARTADLYSGRVGGYFRSASRIAPYNLYGRTSELLAEARGASTAHDIGFRFGPAPAGGQATAGQSLRYPAASYAFTWSAASGRWLVAIDGRPAMTTDAGQLSAATVVIQHTTVRTSPYLEQGRVRPPYAETTGSGTAVVLRDGKAYQALWSRPSADGGTTFATPTGLPMTFAPGPVWVVLVSR
jgi:hypothetical protein